MQSAHFPIGPSAPLETQIPLTTFRIKSSSSSHHLGHNALRQRRYSCPDAGGSTSKLRRKSHVVDFLVRLCVMWSILSAVSIVIYAIFFTTGRRIHSRGSSPIVTTSLRGLSHAHPSNLENFDSKFEGPRWVNSAQTLEQEVFFENKWLSLSRHTVRTHPSLSDTSNSDTSSDTSDTLSDTSDTSEFSQISQISSKSESMDTNAKDAMNSDDIQNNGLTSDHINRGTIDDWFWIDSMDTVNVLASIFVDGIEYFIIFEQTKYGINGPTYSVVGGHIEPQMDGNAENSKDFASDAAQRELMEELGIVVRNKDDLIEFNQNEGFRTDVNRGLGFCHTFLARNVGFKDGKVLENYQDLRQLEKDMEFFDETEQLHVRFVELSELIDIYQKGMFKEAKWSNTVGLGIMHVLLKDSNVDSNGNKYLLL